MKSPPDLILASTSSYRRALLARVHGSFQCLAPGVDEQRQADESAVALVTRLSLAKARAVAALRPEAWVIGSDQAAVLLDDRQQQRILGKPGTPAHCIEQLTSCSGKTVAYLTGVAVVRGLDSAVFEFVDTTRVTFRRLDAAAIERYVARESPLDCAGGFKSEGLGIALCSSIDSDDPTALIGLPLIRLCAILRRLGFDIP
ncbi:MAG TPA: Maf family protein [Steroidobacteraceae bacterium]|nr:Maf family protein [Steroidobacteraceae bacterium]